MPTRFWEFYRHAQLSHRATYAVLVAVYRPIVVYWYCQYCYYTFVTFVSGQVLVIVRLLQTIRADINLIAAVWTVGTCLHVSACCTLGPEMPGASPRLPPTCSCHVTWPRNQQTCRRCLTRKWRVQYPSLLQLFESSQFMVKPSLFYLDFDTIIII